MRTLNLVSFLHETISTGYDTFHTDAGMDIDEVSPDEQDQQNARALRSQGTPRVAYLLQHNDVASTGDDEDEQSDDSRPFSVLNAHHRTNRTIRAPNPHNLEHISNSQRPTSRKSTGQKQAYHRAEPEVNQSKPNNVNSGRKNARKQATVEPEEADDEESDHEDSGMKKRAPRHSKSNNKDPKPTQARFYSRPFSGLIEVAKNYYRLNIHTAGEPFPDRNSRTIRVAGDCFLDAVNLYQEDEANPPLDEGEFFCYWMTKTDIFNRGF